MVSSEHEFSKNYLILKPQNANLFDLLLFILPFGFRKRKFIDCPEGKENSYSSFADRWIIFVSMLLQNFLGAIAIPLAILDTILQKVLNFISFNGGIPGVLYKLVTKKPFVHPDKNSPNYTSLVGFTDWRKDLDNSIKPDDIYRYYAGLTIMAAKCSYESQPFVKSVVNDHWKMKFLESYDFWNDFQNKATTQAFVFQNTATDPDVTVIAFRGTSPLDAHDWQVDADFSWYELEGVGCLHSGFMKGLGLQKGKGWPKEISKGLFKHQFAYYTLRQKLRDIAQSNKNARFIITGHSLGAALATVFVTILAYHEETTLLQKLQAVYTYGQPRVGDQQFAEFMLSTVQKYGIRYYRYVYCNDLVPRVPADGIIFKYKHFGGCVYFNSLYKGRVLKEQPNKNYFSVFWIIPMHINAWWELIRSFMIPIVKGSVYHEGLVTKGMRVIGLMVPGVSNHLPQDYVNSTRLGHLKIMSDDIEDPILGNHIEDDY